MGLLVRTTQTGLFVSVHDPDAVLPAADVAVWPGPNRDWLPSSGQPASCARFEIRALSPAEWQEIIALYASDNTQGRDRLVQLGLVAIDGQPADLDSLAAGWAQEISNLISDVTVVPMVGRRSRSTDGQSQG